MVEAGGGVITFGGLRDRGIGNQIIADVGEGSDMADEALKEAGRLCGGSPALAVTTPRQCLPIHTEQPVQ